MQQHPRLARPQPAAQPSNSDAQGRPNERLLATLEANLKRATEPALIERLTAAISRVRTEAAP
jgi:hypothetical protein